MYRPRNEFLSGPALPADEHGHIGIRNAMDQRADFAHLLTCTEQFADNAWRPGAGRRGAGCLVRPRSVFAHRVAPAAATERFDPCTTLS
jgi:hypothetical protein